MKTLVYFPEVEKLKASIDWVTLGFADWVISNSCFLNYLKEDLFTLSAHTSLKCNFDDTSLSDIWHILQENFEGSSNMVKKFLPFLSTCLVWRRLNNKYDKLNSISVLDHLIHK